MDDSHNSNESNDHKPKDKLYKFYYDIMKEIQGHSIIIDPGIYHEILESTSLDQIIDYIKQSIHILIQKKEEKLNPQLTQLPSNSNSDGSEGSYESQLRKMEKDIRKHLKNHFQAKLQIEALEKKIRSYLDMEEEYNEMKEKLKYENGKFLNNDRKDNEILILRAENSNIKASIANLEEIHKAKEEDILKKEKTTIKALNKQIDTLKETISKLERMSHNCNSKSCNNINIQINQNGSLSSKWVTRNEEENNYTSFGRHPFDLDKINTSDQDTMKKINSIKQYKQNANKTKNKLTKETYNTHYTINSAKSPNKIIHNKNNSINMKLTDIRLEELGLLKNINNYSNININRLHLQQKKNMKKINKITHLIPTSKLPISQRSKLKQQQLTKLYFTSKNSKRNGNYSDVGIKTYERI